VLKVRALRALVIICPRGGTPRLSRQSSSLIFSPRLSDEGLTIARSLDSGLLYNRDTASQRGSLPERGSLRFAVRREWTVAAVGSGR
jgi:hypothetical protein